MNCCVNLSLNPAHHKLKDRKHYSKKYYAYYIITIKKNDNKQFNTTLDMTLIRLTVTFMS